MSPAPANPTPAATPHAAAAQILRDRARLLARPHEAVAEQGSEIEVLEFRLAQETWALETRHIREVAQLKDLTPLPSTPPFIVGIVNIRGQILPVIDLKRFFELPETGLTDLHRIILVEGNGLKFGLLADTTIGVRSIPLNTLQPALATLSGARASYFKGVTADHLIVLDLDHVLTDPNLLVNDDADA